MRPSMPSIPLGILLSFLLASCALPPQPENGGVISSEIGQLRVYPDTLNNPVHLGEPVVFEFIPTVENIQLTDLKIDTGESGKPALGCGHNQFPCKEGGAIRSIRATHKYSKEGSYNAVLQYQGVPVAEKKIIIVEQYLTDEELCYQVSKKVAGELKKGINWVTATSKDSTNAKFAFSSLSNANFEYEEEEGYPHDVEVIYSLMQALVEEKTVNDRYVILERAPQALVRLAHESLYTADPNDSNAPLREYKKLEYGLNTFNQGEKRPISYSIKLAGVNDTRSSMGNTGHGD
ncbi:MAG: hypothetical protein D3905_15815, partial [Candidatus Electrothrix sp. AS4_5]|nr:hypothetical protein [Candidatus Electrothrix gigas]